MTNEKRCLLGQKCKLAGNTEQCHDNCPLFIGLHGRSGDNGRSGFSRVPLEHRYTTVTTSPVRIKQPNAYRYIDAYAKSFMRYFDNSLDAKDRIKSIYMWSEKPGTGKTTTAISILNSFLAYYYLECLRRTETPVQRPTYFLSMNSLQKEFLQMSRQGVPIELQQIAGEKYYNEMNYAKQAELVVFDDVGTRSVSEAFRNDILDIIDYRQAHMKPSIFTSNLPIHELPALFGEERLFDRIRDLCIDIHFEEIESGRGKRS
jgi:DNA replication protein DnaC